MGFLTRSPRRVGPPAPVTSKNVLVLISFGAFLLLTSFVMLFIDPVLIIAKYNMRVSIGSPVHELLKKRSDSIHVSVYLFNVTNTDDFMSGKDDKLKMEEVGPFTYKEVRYNEDLELDNEGGVLRYTPNITAEFIAEESMDDPRNVSVSMANLAMLGMSSMMSSYPYVTRLGFNFLTGQVSSKAIVDMKAHDFLWGYRDPLITLGYTYIPGWIYFNTLGLLDRMYDKEVLHRFEVGMTNKDKFTIKSVDGFEGLNMWEYEDPTKRTKCNSFQNTYEGIAYPTELTPETPVRIYHKSLCRFFDLDYVETKHLDYGAEAYLYALNNDTYKMDSDRKCLCSRGMCTDGMSDISPCFYGLPFSISNPHFSGADPSLYKRIEGMRPDEKKYKTEFMIEPKIGVPIATHLAVQMNIVVTDVKYNSQTSKFADMVVPVAYFIIQQPPVPQKTVDDLHLMYVTGPKIFLAVKIVSLLLALAMLAYAVHLAYWDWLYAEGRSIVFQLPTDAKQQNIILDIDLSLLGHEYS